MPGTLMSHIDGVDYFELSTLGSPAALADTICGFDRPSILVMGGYDEGQPLEGLAQAIEDHGVIHVFLVGDDVAGLEAALRSIGFDHITNRNADFGRIIRECHAIAEPGDMVVFVATDKDRASVSGFRSVIERIVRESKAAR